MTKTLGKVLVKDFLPTENEELSELLSSGITLHAIIPITSTIYLGPSEIADNELMSPTKIAMGKEKLRMLLRGASEKKRGYDVTWIKVIYSPTQ